MRYRPIKCVGPWEGCLISTTFESVQSFEGELNYFGLTTMYTAPTRPYEDYFELHPETRNTVDGVYENVVEDESATDVGVQRGNMGNTNQDGSNRRQAPAKKLNASRKDVRKIQRMLLLIVVAVVITFLTAVVALVFVITIKWPRNTPAASKQGAQDGTIQGRLASESYT